MPQAEYSLDFFWERETVFLKNTTANTDLLVLIKKK